MTVADIVVLLSFIVIVIICTKRGLALTLYSMFSTIIAIVGAFVLKPFVSELLTNMGANDMFASGILKQLKTVAEQKGIEGPITAKEFISGINLPGFAGKALEDKITTWQNSSSVEKVMQDISSKTSELLVNILSVVVLVILILLLMIILKKVLKIFSKVPVVKEINKIGGFVAGIVLAFAWLTILGAIVHLFSVTPSFSVVMDSINNSLFAKCFYDTNVIMTLLS